MYEVIRYYKQVESISTTSTPNFDVLTVAWINSVIANGGTVSAARQIIVNNLIAGLRSDGLVDKLDRLWLFAAENAGSARTDLLARTLATLVNSPAFAVDRGYTGDGATNYVDTNVNPITTGGLQYAQNAACFFAWSNTAGANAKPWLAGQLAVASNTAVIPMFTDNNDYWGITTSAAGGTVTVVGDGLTGLYLANRTGAAAATWNVNGAQRSTDVSASAAPSNSDFCALNAGGGFGVRQCSCMGFGGTLSGTDRTNIYNRLRAYMTAVGVP